MRQTENRDGYRSRRERRASEHAYARIMGGTERRDRDAAYHGQEAARTSRHDRRRSRRADAHSWEERRFSHADDYEEDLYGAEADAEETYDAEGYGNYDDDYRDDDYRDDDYRDDDYREDGYDDDDADAYGADAYDAVEEREAGRGPVRRRRGRYKAAGRRKKKPFWLIALLLAAVLAFFGWMLAKNLMQGENWTIAVFGVDSREGELEKNTRSDVIMLVNVNQKTGEIKLASVYRDTYLRVNDNSEYNKINKAYEEGGHAQAVKALEENLNLTIDDYMTFSWAAVAKGINALGGIDLEISDAEFSIINGFITETVNSTGIGSVQLTHPGMQHLDGVQAVAYGRLRLIDTDFNRTARQRKVLSLAMDKAKQADSGTLVQLAAALLPEVSTSIGIDDMVPVLKNLNRYQIAGTKGFPFSLKTMDIGRLDVVVPTTLESNVVLLHQFLYNDAEYTAPQRVKDISARIGRDSGLTEPGKELADFGTDGGVVYHAPEPMTEAPVTEPVTESTELSSEAESSLEENASEETEETDESGAEEPTEDTLAEDGAGLRPTEPAEDPAGGPGTENDTEKEKQTEAADKKENGGESQAPSETDAAEPVTKAPQEAETEAGPGTGAGNSSSEIGPGPGAEDAKGQGTVISDAPGPGNA